MVLMSKQVLPYMFLWVVAILSLRTVSVAVTRLSLWQPYDDAISCVVYDI